MYMQANLFQDGCVIDNDLWEVVPMMLMDSNLLWAKNIFLENENFYLSDSPDFSQMVFSSKL